MISEPEILALESTIRFRYTRTVPDIGGLEAVFWYQRCRSPCGSLDCAFRRLLSEVAIGHQISSRTKIESWHFADGSRLSFVNSVWKVLV